MLYEVKKVEVVGKIWKTLMVVEFGVGEGHDKPVEDKNAMIVDLQM